jgi:hypothetical protein
LDSGIVWVHAPGEVDVSLCADEVTPHQVHVTLREMNPRVIGIQRERLFRLVQCLDLILVFGPGNSNGKLFGSVPIDPGEACVGSGEAGVDLEGLFE